MLDFNFDIFREDRKDIFMQRTIIPTQTGFVTAPWANFGKVKNQGIEMTLNFHKQWTKDLFEGYASFADRSFDE